MRTINLKMFCIFSFSYVYFLIFWSRICKFMEIVISWKCASLVKNWKTKQNQKIKVFVTVKMDFWLFVFTLCSCVTFFSIKTKKSICLTLSSRHNFWKTWKIHFLFYLVFLKQKIGFHVKTCKAVSNSWRLD